MLHTHTHSSPYFHDSRIHGNWHSGHSLGAGTAILLKILLARNATEVLKGDNKSAKGERLAPARLNVGRPVRVECYAFAPPPVFSAPVGAPWMQDVYSFVNG